MSNEEAQARIYKFAIKLCEQKVRLLSWFYRHRVGRVGVKVLVQLEALNGNTALSDSKVEGQ